MAANEERAQLRVVVNELIDALTAVSAGEDQFVAHSPDWWWGDRVFGGMVIAQGLSAACQTVPDGLAPHSLHAYFLRPTKPEADVSIGVRRVRDGRTFTTRDVTAAIDDKTTFTMTCSFHEDEGGDDYQPSMPDVPGPETVVAETEPMPFDIRELGPTPRGDDGFYHSTRRVWMRTRTPLGDDPAAHACLIAYLSDMTRAAFRPLSLDTWGTHTDASLDHAVWFHRPCRADQWMLFDFQALVNANGRSTIRGVMFDETGRLCVSMAQELLIRPLEDAVAEPFGIDVAKVDPTRL